MRLRSSVMPFSMRCMLPLTQQYPAKGAATTTAMRQFRNQRQYLIGSAIKYREYYKGKVVRPTAAFTRDLAKKNREEEAGKESFAAVREGEVGLLIIFAQFQRKQAAMRNNLTPALPFHKKQCENGGRTAPGFLARQGQSPGEASEKKISAYPGEGTARGEGGVSGKQIQTTEEESIASDPVSSCTSSEITTKPSKAEQKLPRENRASSPLRYEPLSPLRCEPLSSLSPRHASPSSRPPPFSPIRATLKHLLHSKGSPGRHEDSFQAGGHSTREVKLTASIRGNKTFVENLQSPAKGLEKENQILREENELLRRELSEIKKNLMFGSGGKKDDVISNLRCTIKKEDNEIKELRLKLDIFTKKNAALATLIENKDEELAFLNGKLAAMEEELDEHKGRNAERFEKLKERINFTLRSYGELEGKWSRAEMDWLSFKEKWIEEKGIYLHRIAFLEDYIANN